MKRAPISARRLWALCRKESWQIMRDPSSILVAFVMPVMLLFIFGYAVNLDADHVRVGLLQYDNGAVATRFAQSLANNHAFDITVSHSRSELEDRMAHGRLRGVIVLDNDFSRRIAAGQPAMLQLLVDGSEPNTAKFIASYAQGALEIWLRSEAQQRALPASAQQSLLDVRLRTWYNPAAISRNFLVPGSIAVVMTIIGALLTSLVVAREWERGTMEALLATPVTRAELLLSKILPYYVLGIAAVLLCLLVAQYVMGVPFRGSLLALLASSSLFLGSAMGFGLFLSTIMRNQFFAAQAALTAAFLPALMLSGFMFEIRSMPPLLQWFTRLIPARYYTSTLQTLFQAGDVVPLLLGDALWLSLLTAFWLTLTARKTKRTLD